MWNQYNSVEISYSKSVNKEDYQKLEFKIE